MSFRKPIKAAGSAAASGLAVFKENVAEQSVTCSCGWGTRHPREKIRVGRAERHAERRHTGRAIYL